MNFTKIDLEDNVPLFLILMFFVGVIGALIFSNLFSNNFERINLKDVFQSCEKTGFFYSDNKVIKCEVMK
jgi:hypothetical protein